MRTIPTETQNYIAKQTVCALNVLSGAASGTALALGLVPMLEGRLCAWRIGLVLGLAAVSAALWWTARWIERYAL